jgi:heptosyltransferase-3
MTSNTGVIPFDSVRRALVVNLRHIGDVLLSGVVPHALKAHAPHCEIDALIYSDSAAMLEGHPEITQLHLIDRLWKKSGILKQASAEWALLHRLRSRHYDLVIMLTPHRRGQWLVRALRPRWAVAPPYPAAAAGWKRCFPRLVHRPIASWRHVVEIYLDSLRVLGCFPGPGERNVPLVPGTVAESHASALLQQEGINDGHFVVIHPGSRWSFKCMPASTIAEVVDALVKRGHQVVLTGAPNDVEQEMILQILARTSCKVCNLAGKLSLKELAAVIARSRLFIGVDSAPMHMAAALNVPQVAVFGPSGAREWGPWSHKARVLTNCDYQCVPCGRAGCANSKRSECLAELPVARLITAIDEQLAATALNLFIAPEWCSHLTPPMQ